jgi:hypothetical protein
MKTMKQSYPRRSEMLATPFLPLSDAEFRELVLSGQAIPGTAGGLTVAKWSDRPGVGADEFLTALRGQGGRLEVRRFKSDTNVRIVPSHPSRGGIRRASVITRKTRP